MWIIGSILISIAIIVLAINRFGAKSVSKEDQLIDDIDQQKWCNSRFI